MKRYLFLISLVFFCGCSDNAIVKLYDKDFEKIDCLKLSVFPPDEMITKSLKELYKFDKNCNNRFLLTHKGGIVCNSTYNVAKKTTTNFPSGYIKVQITQKDTKIYTYYNDLRDTLDKDDIKKAFRRVKKDLKID